jgi:pilus assembly protein CpaE
MLQASSANAALREFLSAKEICPNAETIVFVGPDASPEEVRKLFRAGARDVLSMPVANEQLMSSLGEAIGPGVSGEARGFVLGVVKAAGGVGATTLAVNIAGHFASPPRTKRGDRLDPTSVAILDFDLQFGGAALALDIAARKDITEVLRNPKRLDTHFLDGVMERHRTGVRVLASPTTIVPVDAMNSDVALAIADTAARSHDLVIIEFPAAWADWTGALLRRCDHLLLTSTAAVRGVAGARRILDAAGEMNVEASRWSLVFNRLNSILDGNDIVEQARRALGPAVLGSLMEDPAVRVAGDRGRMIWETAPTTRFAKDLRPICAEIMQMVESKQYPRAQRTAVR